ncbi:MAG: 3'-5' exonuclease, partial [Planctomycetaceae bacterium]|nr:3'-5' exonuclease [Planctomycetaceae bacterium]
FIPYTFQVPVSVVIGKVTEDFQLVDLVALDVPEYRPHVITRDFWHGWEVYNYPTLVSFNGRGFDIPLLELAAYRYGLNLKKWYAIHARSFDQPRNRFNVASHLDLMEILTNHGASRFTGGLNLLANMLGKPGKMDVQGNMVQQLYEQGELDRINDYCRCDVLDTYYAFLRAAVVIGWLSLDQEQQIVEKTHDWLQQQASDIPALQQYLENWGNWLNPWTDQDKGN